MSAQSWMQFNVPVLSHILSRAFEHIRTSAAPFNFYVAARNDNPNPATMSNHIANFLRLVHDLPDDAAVDMAQEVVAAGCVSWAFREFTQGKPYTPIAACASAIGSTLLFTDWCHDNKFESGENAD